MLSKTLQYGPNDYGIGTKIPALRLKKKLIVAEWVIRRGTLRVARMAK
jgi:hypothetical protein